MRLVLEIKSGEHAGHKKWLRLGERMLVGRTEQAELVVPDPRMSSVHFYVECTSSGCQLRDTRSTNGTFLNGKRITEDVLHNGDTISAGDTRFGVEITEDVLPARLAEEPEPPAATEREWVTAVRKTVAAPHSEMRDPLANESRVRPMNGSESSGSGATERKFPGGGSEVTIVAQHLGEMSPLHLIFDFAKIGRKVPATLANPSFLYDWLPEKQLAGFSPIVMAGSAGIDVRELIELGWGYSCLVIVFSTLPEEELVKRLRTLTLTGDSPEPYRKYASPETLGELLSKGPEPFVSGLFDAVDAVMYESDNADVCCLRASPKFAPKLRELDLPSLP